ncbi:MAG: DUF6350 family protein [Bifidobacterium tibiigranuli]|jgi:hypothetical protein|uniref:cell division protein PerM n=1 Tax=Bifidobacterium tibiigranuli TaxID=2172043 RepID=UPI0026F21450|nr:DUF6350 family protein [Bifidobacterium tibiigranuli]MCI1673449.1 DUF6350 family protein [Bifidobacterium tibiigranuli]MCI1712749.1 DUF6350 family protein [Bifidobacterium tibiigranuli]MCI1834853.1 DUF6350 family protein [Bifidobacterium tibiigranuli]
MRIRPRQWLNGAGAALASIAIYSISLGFFMALMLLVISMEEGGDNLSQLSIPLGEAIVLLSQGVGFQAGAIKLTIIPLLLTILLIALIRSLTLRLGCSSWEAYIAGAVSWMVLNAILAQGVTVGLLDSLWLVCLKTLLVFTVGFVGAALPASGAWGRFVTVFRAHTSAPLRTALSTGAFIGGALIACYMLAGVIVAIVWVVRGHGAMLHLFDLTGMQSGSKILTTICSLAWLPNLCIWAIAWLFGSSFFIGDLATFNLWTGRAVGLPPLPVFALLPEPVANATWRIVLMSIPLALGFIIGALALVLRRGFAIRFIDMDDAHGDAERIEGEQNEQKQDDNGHDLRSTIVRFACAAGSFCLASVIVALGMTLLFLLSNGALGHQRLARVGVDVAASTQSASRPGALGLFAAWLIMLIVVSGVFAARTALARRRTRLAAVGEAADDAGAAPTSSDSDSVDDDASDNGTTADAPSTRVISSMTKPKEDHDDDNTSTDTTGSGIRLP